MFQQPEDEFKLALEKHKLSYLQTKHITAWMDADIDKLVDTLFNEDVAPIVRIPFTRSNINILLASSYCRRCGECCSSNPLNLGDPGIMVFEKELKLIAKHSTYSYKRLKKLSGKYENPERDDVRHLPFPCIFYEQGKCTIYDIRPFTCKIYPVKDSPPRGGKVYISLSLRCDYGKDIYRSLVYREKKNKQNKLFQV